MHWVIQDNIYHEDGLERVMNFMRKMGLSHSVHKVVPFSGELIPDINPEGPVICLGAYSMNNIAKKRGWKPGSFTNDDFDYERMVSLYPELCLNSDAQFDTFETIQPKWDNFFLRPVADTKAFAGAIFTRDEFETWRHKVMVLKEDVGTTLSGATRVVASEPKKIYQEWRFWIVDGEPVTSSLYKEGQRVRYSDIVDEEVKRFAMHTANTFRHDIPMLVSRSRSEQYRPDRAYCLDVCRIDDSFDGLRVVEINCINSCGLYAADVGKLIVALEDTAYHQSWWDRSHQ